jgi:glycosyltransferase involved in cell wall biosynthesis
VDTVAVVIPALNCAPSIAAAVRAARAVVAAVVVVDDGSTDDTAARAADAGADVVRHAVNQGKGAALLSGLHWARDHAVDRVVTMDGDGQHLSEEIPKLLVPAVVEGRALVIGARQIETAVAPHRLFGNRFANRWVEIACGQALPDTQSGFRSYPVRETLALHVRAQRFGFETEVLIRAARAGMPLRTVPVRVYYPPIDERVSHFRPVVDTIRIIFVVVGLILRVW